MTEGSSSAVLAQEFGAVRLAGFGRQHGDAFGEGAQIGRRPGLGRIGQNLARLGERGFAPENLLHVAQSLFHDHAPAKAMGLKTAWIDRRGSKPGGATAAIGEAEARPDHRFESLAALATAVVVGDG